MLSCLEWNLVPTTTLHPDYSEQRGPGIGDCGGYPDHPSCYGLLEKTARAQSSHDGVGGQSWRSVGCG